MRGSWRGRRRERKRRQGEWRGGCRGNDDSRGGRVSQGNWNWEVEFGS